MSPLVTVICLCYNHESYVRAAIQSVLDQDYKNIQFIIVDDASTDDSVHQIHRAIMDSQGITFLVLEENLGNCKAFNRGLALAKGDFVIDLAGDDILLPNRITNGLNMFASLGDDYGVQFGDAELITATGESTGFHSDRFPSDKVPVGDIYQEVVRRYFICSPTMMMRSAVLEKLAGYDETLAYEDFDFWIRSAREFKYCYSEEVLVKKRMLKNSLASRQHQRNSQQMYSTYAVCEKIFYLNRTPEEQQILKGRVGYELRRAIQVGEFRLAWKYAKLYYKG